MGRIVPDHSAFRKRNRFEKPGRVGSASQHWIPTGEQSGLLTHIGMNGKRFIVHAEKSWPRLFNWNRQSARSVSFLDFQASFGQEDPQHYGYDEHQLQSPDRM